MGLSPLSYSLPLLNIIEKRAKRINLFKRGIKGVSIRRDRMQIVPKESITPLYSCSNYQGDKKSE